MRGRYPCGGMHRREFLGATALPLLMPSVLNAQQSKKGAASPPSFDGQLGVPGPFPGRVVEVKNPALDRGSRKDRTAIRATLNRGLVSLTGGGRSGPGLADVCQAG